MFHSNTIPTNESSPPDIVITTVARWVVLFTLTIIVSGLVYNHCTFESLNLVLTCNHCTFVSVKLVFHDPQGTKKEKLKRGAERLKRGKFAMKLDTDLLGGSKRNWDVCIWTVIQFNEFFLSPFCRNKTSDTFQGRFDKNKPFNGRHSVPRLPLATGSAWSLKKRWLL